MMTNSVALTAKDIKTLPTTVQATVQAYQKRYRTRKVTLTTHKPDWAMYIAEGASYQVYYEGTGKSASFTAQSERTMHAGGPAISHMVGQYCPPPFPTGTYVVEFELFLGKPIIEVHKVVELI